jgi:S-adenosylmethionine-dependent methyltransferase
MNPVDIEKVCDEHTKFHVEIEKILRQTYYKGIDKQLCETEELKNDIKDHVFRRYERTLIYYIPWITKVFDLSDKEITEIGCGTGSRAAAFSHFTKHIYAYEVSESSVLAARARMQIMGINNVSIIQSAPDDLLETLKSNHSSGVSVILLFTVMEHMTIQERLKTLKEAWDLLLPGGTLIVAETPNRLTYFDYHTSQLPFFHLLPLELAVKYYENSSRNQFKLAIKKQLESGTVADAKNALIRWGNAVSYHEFGIALGSNLKDLLVTDGDSEEMRNLYPLSTEEKLLQQYFIEAKIDRLLTFTNQIFNLIFQKKKPPCND